MKTLQILEALERKYAAMQLEQAAARAELAEILAKTKSPKDQKR